jgi:hypothetical protein
MTDVLIKATAISVLLLGTASTVSAQTSSPIKEGYRLPLQGAYGNEPGCNSLRLREPVTDDMQYVTGDEYKGWESSCSFAFAYEGWASENDKSWTVITSCGAEGTAYSELLSVHEHKDLVSGELTLTIKRSGQGSEPVVLKFCK